MERAFADLDARIPALAPHEVIIGMQRIVAMVGDGHTRIAAFAGQPGVPPGIEGGFVNLPVGFQHYPDGLRVQTASDEFKGLLGARLLAIGDVPVDEVLRRVTPLAHRDNAMTVKLVTPFLLPKPAVLHATGVIDEFRTSVSMTFETLERDTVDAVIRHAGDGAQPLRDVLDASSTTPPMWRDDRRGPYWFAPLQNGRSLYVQVSASRNGDGETLPEFAGRLAEHLAATAVERVVVDIRRNGGGDNQLTRPLVGVLGGWEHAADGRRLVVVIGRSTFSAAQVFATELERYTGAVFVGEPTGGRPNQYGEIESTALPNSGLRLFYSSWYFQTADPWDDRAWVPPHIAVEPAIEDLIAGNDPALEIALRLPLDEPPLADRLLAEARERGLEAALQSYDAYRARPEHRYRSGEEALSELLIHYWRADELDNALRVARTLVRDNPASAEAHENLAETYEALGKTREAAEHALESLRLSPRNGDALEVLREACADERALLREFVSPAVGRHGGRALRIACGLPEAPGSQ